MLPFAQQVERFWWRKQPPARWLQPLAAVYQWVNQCNLLRRHRGATVPAIPVVFIGNITVGGSGKTPFVLALAQALQQRGIKPVIVCRGDGGSLQQPRLVTPGADPSTVGDEACMMAQATAIPVVAGRDRVVGAELAATLGDVMLLDDGLQYRQLARVVGYSCEVVLIPAAGLGNGALLPIGPLREPLSPLHRAVIAGIPGDAQGDVGGQVEVKACFHWSNPVTGLRDMMNHASTPRSQPTRIHLVTAIARSHRVVVSLEGLGFEIMGHTQFADHYRYRSQDVHHLCAQLEPVVTTMKDAAKLQRLWPAARPLWVCQHQSVMDSTLVDRVLLSVGGPQRNFGSNCGTD